MDLCLICDKSLSSEPTVKVRSGITKLIECSELRKDGKFTRTENFTYVELHIECRKDYTRRDPLNKSSEPMDVEFDEFDINSQCCFCGKKCVKDKKLPKNKFEDIHKIDAIDFLKNVFHQCNSREDDNANAVAGRLHDLIDVDFGDWHYHGVCYKKFIHPMQNSKAKTGRPINIGFTTAFKELCNYIDENDECQYNLTQLVSIFEKINSTSDTKCDSRTLLKHIKWNYGDKVIIRSVSGKVTQLFFIDILTETSTLSKLERNEILKKAAEILRYDIRSMYYNCEEFPTLGTIDATEALFPNSFNLFMRDLIFSGKKAKDFSRLERKVYAIQEIITKVIRERSYVSPLLTNVGFHLHRIYDSKYLNQLLEKLGFGCSYADIGTFETAATLAEDPKINERAFLQMVFDNADINVRTLDGRNTFHAMGGITCVTPANAVSLPETLPRKYNLPPNHTFSTTPILSYIKPGTLNLKSKIVENIENTEPKNLLKYQKMDTLLAASLFFNERLESWGGFMSHNHNKKNEGFFVTKVFPVPFINLDPGDLNTIHTALRFALKQTKQIGMDMCIVTFDQPLYAKAYKIVNCANKNDPMSKIFVRLGGFHLIMSFLGSIGFIMGGSGLEEALETIYAKNSIVHIINGHAYERAIRAHFLIHVVLTKLILQNSKMNPDTTTHIENFIKETDFSKIDEAPIDELMDTIQSQFEILSESNKTAELWLQYWKQISILKYYIRAERMGDFDLQVYCIRCMLPYFHSAGHLAYAKYAHLYLQDALNLKTTMKPEEYKRFTDDGMFTIRRKNHFWSGTWSDMVIEQSLMRLIKISGGLTHGRGVTDRSLAKWIASIPYCCKIGDFVDEFCEMKRYTSLQHKDLSESRKFRDHHDQDELLKFFECHNPFKIGSETAICSIVTGIVGGPEINCYNSEEHGRKIMRKLVGQNFEDIKLKRSDKVKTLNPHTIKVRDETVVIDPRQLFNRIICTATSAERLEICFEYELSTEATSIFLNRAMRKTTKSSLFKCFDKYIDMVEEINTPSSPIYYIDGGMLLHKVVWQPSTTFRDIYNQYKNYIMSHYGRRVHIIFDGYEDRLSTKNQEQTRRAGSMNCPDILFEDNMVLNVTQSKFLSNSNNKLRFIAGLSATLLSHGYSITKCPGDADTTIADISLALSHSNGSSSEAVVVADDIDILVLLLHHCESSNVYMMRSFGSHELIHIHSLQQSLGHLKDCILFLHSVSGCDTTSAFFNKGKAATFKILEKNKKLAEQVAIFLQEGAKPERLTTLGEEFTLLLYGAPKDVKSVNKLRYFKFNQITARKSLNSEMQLASLPPSKTSLDEHFYRVYHQIQEWCGNKLIATNWGWMLKNNALIPKQGREDVPPDFVMELIFCNCKKSLCQSLCSCRKFGLKCTAQCGNCCGTSCSNKFKDEEVDDFELSE